MLPGSHTRTLKHLSPKLIARTTGRFTTSMSAQTPHNDPMNTAQEDDGKVKPPISNLTMQIVLRRDLVEVSSFSVATSEFSSTSIVVYRSCIGQ
jgi:hypothetical protein